MVFLESYLSGCSNADSSQSALSFLEIPDNITLLPLPPYSPELNPMENVWDYPRGNVLSHKVWDTYDAVAQACAKAWRFLINDPNRIRTLAHRNWACVNG